MPIANNLLLAHADRRARRGLAIQLELDGHTVDEAGTAAAARELLRSQRPALVVLGGLERPAASVMFLRDLRAGRLDAEPDAAVLTLGGSDAVSQLRAYEAGSDHHLPADVSYVLLREIISAVLRRAVEPRASSRRLEFGPLSIDVACREVRVGNDAVRLTAKEFDLLRSLAAEPLRVFTKQELLTAIWGYDESCSTRTLDSHACRLRRRLSESGRPGLVVNHWGVGYALAST